MTKDELRQEYIIPALDAFESIMDKGVTECENFWDEVLHHPEYPTSRAFAWLNHLENAMCSSEPASEFEAEACKMLPNIVKVLADWDNCVTIYK